MNFMFDTPKCFVCNVEYKSIAQLDMHMKKVHQETEYERQNRLQKMALEALNTNKNVGNDSEEIKSDEEDVEVGLVKGEEEMNLEIETYKDNKGEDHGITIKSKSKTFKEAKEGIKHMIVKGASYNVGGRPMEILYVVPNRPGSVTSVVQVKQGGISGKVELVLWNSSEGKNRHKKSTTIEIKRMPKEGSDFSHVKKLKDIIVRLLNRFQHGEDIKIVISDMKKNAHERTIKPKAQKKGIKEENFKCQDCGDIFEKQVGLNIHTGRKHRSDIKCSVKMCSYTCKQSEMNGHIEEQHTEKGYGYPCDTCSRIWNTKHDLDLHDENHHRLSRKNGFKPKETPGGKTDKDTEEDESSEKRKCEQCDLLIEGTNFKNVLMRMKRHKEVCVLKDTRQEETSDDDCEECCQQFKNSTEFRKHKKDVHGLRTISMSPKSKRNKKYVENKTCEKMMELSQEDFILDETKKILKHLEIVSWEEIRISDQKMDHENYIPEKKIPNKRKLFEEDPKKGVKREAKSKANREKNRVLMEKKRKDRKNNIARATENIESDMDYENEPNENKEPRYPGKGKSKKTVKLDVSSSQNKVKENEAESNEPIKDTTKVEENLPEESINITNLTFIQMFKNIGKEASEFFLKNVIGDGACGFRCIALHCSHFENECRKVRRDTNKFIIHHWELLEQENFYGTFKDGIEFNIGMHKRKFHSMIEFLCFLDTEEADLLWMDHADLQMVANMYNIDMKILDAALNKPEWTNITPDPRMEGHTCPVCEMLTYKMKIPKEVMLLHTENHYKLFVPKNSPLAETLGYKPAKSKSSTQKKDSSKDKTKIKQHEKFESDKDTERSDTEESSSNNTNDSDEISGPVYIHIGVPDNNYKILYEQKIVENKRLTDELSKYQAALKEETAKRSEALDVIKIMKTTQETESKIEELSKEKDDKSNKEGNKLNKWKFVNQNEGFKKNNKRKVNNDEKVELVDCPPCDKKFEVSDIEKHIEEIHLEEKTVCTICGKEFLERDIEEHTKAEHVKDELKCEMCPKTYTTEHKTKRHMWRAHTPIDCTLCDKTTESRQSLKHHKQSIHNMTKTLKCKFSSKELCIDGDECLYTHEEPTDKVEISIQNNAESNSVKNTISCQNCDKTYTTDFEIKRHIWRSHQEVECILCGQVLCSRQELEKHKRQSHGITKIKPCRFWSSGGCVDGDECLFSHETIPNTFYNINETPEADLKKDKYCKMGIKCARQCGISDEGHKKVKNILCKFNKKCTKQQCYFKHTAENGAVFQKRQGKNHWL